MAQWRWEHPRKKKGGKVDWHEQREQKGIKFIAGSEKMGEKMMMTSSARPQKEEIFFGNNKFKIINVKREVK